MRIAVSVHSLLQAITAAAFASGLFACPLKADAIASNEYERKPVRSLLEMRRDRVVVQDFDLSCGAAALATLLTYQHGDPVSEQEVAQGLISREEYIANPELLRSRQGFSLLDLKRYVQRRGYQGIAYGQLNLEDLAERAPIMVPVNLSGYNHFVIFRGRVGDQVLFADPAWGNRTILAEQFEDAWLEYPKVGKVGFVVVRSDTSERQDQLAPRPGEVPTTSDDVLRQVILSLP